MNQNTTIVKISQNNSQVFAHLQVKKITGYIDLHNFLEIISKTGLGPNPRLSKVNSVVQDIIESLTISPETFLLKTKGILMSCFHVNEFDRNRFKLTFLDESVDGILDGGHNCLGILKFILSNIDPQSDKQVKSWNDFKNLVSINEDIIEVWKEQVNIHLKHIGHIIPIEIISSVEGLCENEFISIMHEVAKARNTNVQLTQQTIDNKKGYYDLLKSNLDTKLSEKIEWTTNDGGSISSRDIVALSLIPLSKIYKEISLPIIYISKQKCIEVFSKVYNKSKENEEDFKLFASALKIMKDLPWIYDYIYSKFPAKYNENSGKFGKIACVKQKVKDKTPPKSKFYNLDCDYEYPDGFMIPVVAALHELLVIEQNEVKWKCDPKAFLEKELAEIVKPMKQIIEDAFHFEPNKVGKSKLSYDLVSQKIELILSRR